MSAEWKLGISTDGLGIPVNYHYGIIWLHPTSIWYTMMDMNGWRLLGRLSLLGLGISLRASPSHNEKLVESMLLPRMMEEALRARAFQWLLVF